MAGTEVGGVTPVGTSVANRSVWMKLQAATSTIRKLSQNLRFSVLLLPEAGLSYPGGSLADHPFVFLR
jgi:hypothetical protein